MIYVGVPPSAAVSPSMDMSSSFREIAAAPLVTAVVLANGSAPGRRVVPRPGAAGARHLASWVVRRGRSSIPFVWFLRRPPLRRTLAVDSARSSVLQPPCGPRHTLADAPLGRRHRAALGA